MAIYFVILRAENFFELCYFAVHPFHLYHHLATLVVMKIPGHSYNTVVWKYFVVKNFSWVIESHGNLLRKIILT